MTRIFDFLLAFSVYYATFQIIRLTIRVKKAEFLFYAFAMLAFSSIFISNYVDILINYWGYVFDEQLMKDWSGISAIAFALSGVAFLIFNSKPPFARFPISLCFVPLLIIPAFYFAMHTLVLKDWLLSIYQGGAILVALLMNAALIRKSLDYLISLIGYILIGTAYILHWYSVSLVESGDWIWKSFLIAGMFILIHGFTKLESPEEESDVGLANPYIS
jgi:hypothetical protein